MSRIPRPARVAAAVAAYRRDHELHRLFTALATGEVPVSRVCVADNAASPGTKNTCAAAPLLCEWLPQPANKGPGPAWNAAIQSCLSDPSVTHVLVLDDDVVPAPDTLSILLDSLGDRAAAAPLLFDCSDRLWGFPEPQEPGLRKLIRVIHTRRECSTALGDKPRDFCWATGACMLYTRTAFEQVGHFREDFWMLGEDLDFSMRVAAKLGGVFTAAAPVAHLPPPPTDPRRARVANRLKFLALLQNLAFMARHSPHGTHIGRYLPGNLKRYARTEGRSPRTLIPAARAVWLGFRGHPAGTEEGANLRAQTEARMA